MRKNKRSKLEFNFTAVETTNKCRIDKWLWAVRIYKTRSLATDAVDSGKVKVDGAAVKPAYQISIGKTISVRKGPVTYIYEVKGLIEMRVGAPKAQEMYIDHTPPEEILKLTVKEMMPMAFRPRGTGRPTKKERRDIDQFTDDQ